MPKNKLPVIFLFNFSCSDVFPLRTKGVGHEGPKKFSVFFIIFFLLAVSSSYAAELSLRNDKAKSKPTLSGTQGQKPDPEGEVGQHPYLYFMAEELDLVRAKFNSDEYAKLRTNLFQLANSEFAYPPISPEEYLSVDGRYPTVIEQCIETLAFVYLMTGDAIYLTKAKDYVMTTLEYGSWVHARGQTYNDLARVHVARGVATAYDWLYDYFTPQEREQIQTRLLYEEGNYSAQQTGLGEPGELFNFYHQ